MKQAFGDAHYFFALLNPKDQDHRKAVEFGTRWEGIIVTTHWVLMELADGFAEPPLRAIAASFLARLDENPFFRLIPASDEQFCRGFELYRRRNDKGWSLTDCISFVVMADEKLTEALTADRHFEQAGFTALLAVPEA
jgi:uncharacterized protein